MLNTVQKRLQKLLPKVKSCLPRLENLQVCILPV